MRPGANWVESWVRLEQVQRIAVTGWGGDEGRSSLTRRGSSTTNMGGSMASMGRGSMADRGRGSFMTRRKRRAYMIWRSTYRLPLTRAEGSNILLRTEPVESYLM